MITMISLQTFLVKMMIFTDLVAALEEAEYMSEATGKPYYLVGEKDGGCRVTDQAKPGEYLEVIKPRIVKS